MRSNYFVFWFSSPNSFAVLLLIFVTKNIFVYENATNKNRQYRESDKPINRVVNNHIHSPKTAVCVSAVKLVFDFCTLQ